MATTRLEMRLDQAIKDKAEKASALLGMRSLTEYVVRLVEEDASKVIAQHETFTVSNDIFMRFAQACDNAQQPNQALRDAVASTQRLGIE